MTPAELWLEVEAQKEIARDRFERETTQVWQGVRIYFNALDKKRMPDLAELFGRKRVIRRPTLEEQRLSLMAISTQYGIPAKVANG